MTEDRTNIPKTDKRERQCGDVGMSGGLVFFEKRAFNMYICDRDRWTEDEEHTGGGQVRFVLNMKHLFVSCLGRRKNDMPTAINPDYFILPATRRNPLGRPARKNRRSSGQTLAGNRYPATRKQGEAKRNGGAR